MIVGKVATHRSYLINVYHRNTKHLRKTKYMNLNIDIIGEQFLGDRGSVRPSRLIKPSVYMTGFVR